MDIAILQGTVILHAEGIHPCSGRQGTPWATSDTTAVIIISEPGRCWPEAGGRGNQCVGVLIYTLLAVMRHLYDI